MLGITTKLVTQLIETHQLKFDEDNKVTLDKQQLIVMLVEAYFKGKG